MSTDAVKQDSNRTGLRFAKEATPGVLPVTPIWTGLEPNSYKDFGANFKMVARQPINANRQKRKGVVVDMDASGGYQSDLTQSNIQDFAEGVFFADLRKKTELAATGVDSGTGYAVAAGGAGFPAGSLLFAKGFATAANNGLKKVASSDGTHVMASGLTTAAEAGTLVEVGVEAGSGDLTVTGATHPVIGSTTLDFTTLGLIVGEWIYIGGDSAGTQFATAANNGFARVRAIAAHALTLDKSEAVMVTDAGTGKTVRIFFGRVLKNELGTDIKHLTYQFERTLGVPDSGSPSAEQSEYLTNCTFDQLSVTVNTADKVTFDVSVMAGDYETRTGVDGVKSGTRPALVSGNAFNTTSHVRRARVGIVDSASNLFAYASDFSLTVKNNVKANKAISVMGAFEHSAGDFEVQATANLYFTDVAAVEAVRNNADCTFDLVLAQSNAGMVFDIPLLALGDGRLKVQANDPIMLPLTCDAGAASDIDAAMDYTALMCFFDYLPTAAM